jgi:FPC/CPF motif-containing protein YcgG
MRRKYEHFDDEIVTTEDFIERSATRSLITRRAYEVRFPDGTQMETARWLRDELAAYRAEHDGRAAAQDG